MNKSNLSERELLEEILSKLDKQADTSVKQNQARTCQVYNNKDLMDLLGIKDKYLKKLRDNGYIGYSRMGDKYWYTQEDLDKFLHRFHYEAFATNPNLPRQEGGRI